MVIWSWYFDPRISFALCMQRVKMQSRARRANVEAVVRRCSVKKVFLEISQNWQENTSARVSFLIKLQAEVCNFIKKETLAEVFSCEFCEIYKNTFLHRTLLVIASVPDLLISHKARCSSLEVALLFSVKKFSSMWSNPWTEWVPRFSKFDVVKTEN